LGVGVARSWLLAQQRRQRNPHRRGVAGENILARLFLRGPSGTAPGGSCPGWSRPGAREFGLQRVGLVRPRLLRGGPPGPVARFERAGLRFGEAAARRSVVPREICGDARQGCGSIEESTVAACRVVPHKATVHQARRVGLGSGVRQVTYIFRFRASRRQPAGRVLARAARRVDWSGDRRLGERPGMSIAAAASLCGGVWPGGRSGPRAVRRRGRLGGRRALTCRAWALAGWRAPNGAGAVGDRGPDRERARWTVSLQWAEPWPRPATPVGSSRVGWVRRRGA
jgi:hypothetical protein